MMQITPYRRSFRSRLLPALQRRLRRIGLGIEPFLVVREDNFSDLPTTTTDRFSFRFVTEDEIDSLVGFGPSVTRDKMLAWLHDGRRCFTAWDDSRLAAKMWCDYREFNYGPKFRVLQDDEVYLFAAFADPEYRGQGLAPQLRLHCYDALKSEGRSRFYSVTEYFNSSARRFKRKLGAKDELLGLEINLFKRWSHTFTIRKYL